MDVLQLRRKQRIVSTSVQSLGYSAAYLMFSQCCVIADRPGIPLLLLLHRHLTLNGPLMSQHFIKKGGHCSMCDLLFIADKIVIRKADMLWVKAVCGMTSSVQEVLTWRSCRLAAGHSRAAHGAGAGRPQRGGLPPKTMWAPTGHSCCPGSPACAAGVPPGSPPPCAGRGSDTLALCQSPAEVDRRHLHQDPTARDLQPPTWFGRAEGRSMMLQEPSVCSRGPPRWYTVKSGPGSDTLTSSRSPAD